MDTQLLLATLIVGLALAYLVRGMYRTWFRTGAKTACGSGCNSCSKGVTTPPESTRRIALPQV